MRDWLKDNFNNKSVKPTLIVMVYVSRPKLKYHVSENAVTLKKDMEDDSHILDDCFDIIVDNVLDMFVRSYVQDEQYQTLNNEFNATLNNIYTDIENKCLMTSVNVNDIKMYKTISDMYNVIEHNVLERSHKVNIHDISNINDIRYDDNLNVGAYIYNADNDVIKIVVIDHG